MSTQPGALVKVLADWEDNNGSMSAILMSEWDALRQDVMDACVIQSPRMLREELRRLHAANEELVVALEGMLHLDEENHQRHPGDEDVCYEVRKARAALSKHKE